MVGSPLRINSTLPRPRHSEQTQELSPAPEYQADQAAAAVKKNVSTKVCTLCNADRSIYFFYDSHLLRVVRCFPCRLAQMVRAATPSAPTLSSPASRHQLRIRLQRVIAEWKLEIDGVKGFKVSPSDESILYAIVAKHPLLSDGLEDADSSDDDIPLAQLRLKSMKESGKEQITNPPHPTTTTPSSTLQTQLEEGQSTISDGKMEDLEHCLGSAIAVQTHTGVRADEFRASKPCSKCDTEYPPCFYIHIKTQNSMKDVSPECISCRLDRLMYMKSSRRGFDADRSIKDQLLDHGRNSFHLWEKAIISQGLDASESQKNILLKRIEYLAEHNASKVSNWSEARVKRRRQSDKVTTDPQPLKRAKIESTQLESVEPGVAPQVLIPDGPVVDETTGKAVLHFRHKLQRGLLSAGQVPKEAEMKVMAECFTSLEAYKDLDPGIIRSTKICKALKTIFKLTQIPKDEEYHFKQRSLTLVQKWQKILDNNPEGGESLNAESTRKLTSSGEMTVNHAERNTQSVTSNVDCLSPASVQCESRYIPIGDVNNFGDRHGNKDDANKREEAIPNNTFIAIPTQPGNTVDQTSEVAVSSEEMRRDEDTTLGGNETALSKETADPEAPNAESLEQVIGNLRIAKQSLSATDFDRLLKSVRPRVAKTAEAVRRFVDHSIGVREAELDIWGS